MQWFKFYGQDWLTDIKIVRMTAVDKLLFITLLCLADGQGLVKDCDEDTIKQLTHLYQDPYDTDNDWDRATGFLKRFSDNGMITLDTSGDVIMNNWVKRQSKQLTGYERVKRWRDKQKLANTPNPDDNNDNARIDKNRIDTSVAPLREVVEVDEEKPNRTPTAKYPHALEVFSWFPNRQKSWEAMRNLQEREYAEFLYKRGEAKVKGALSFAAKHKGEPYLPKITKPSDLERKWNDLVEYTP